MQQQELGYGIYGLRRIRWYVGPNSFVSSAHYKDSSVPAAAVRRATLSRVKKP